MNDINNNNNNTSNSTHTTCSNTLDGSNKIFHKLCTKYITTTYHNLPEDYHVEHQIEFIKDSVLGHIKKSKKKQYQIDSIIITKEPYNYEKYPNRKGQMHLHGLFIFKDKIRIRSQKSLATTLSFKYKDVEYFPHISKLHSYNDYLNYIQKLQKENPQIYKHPQYYSKISGEVVDILKEQLDDILKNIDIRVRNDLNMVIKNYTYESQYKHIGFIKYLHSLLPSKKCRLEDFLVDIASIKYKKQNYQGMQDYMNVEKIIYDHLNENKKTSPVIYGESDLGKSSMIKAIITEYINENPGMNIAFLVVKNIQVFSEFDTSSLNKYDQVIIYFDDIDYNENNMIDKPDVLKNLFEGSEGHSTLRCLYGTITFTNKMHKIFSMNKEIFQQIQNIAKKYDGINNRIKPYQIIEEYIKNFNKSK